MTITAQQVITEARDKHMAFSPARTGDATLLRALESYKRRLFQKITDVNSSVLQVAATDITIDLSTFDFVNGQDLGQFLYILPDGEVEPQNEIDPGDRAKFTLIGQNVRLFSRPIYSGWMRGNRLFLQGDDRDWNGFLNVHLSIIPMPTGPTAVGDNFDPMPDSGEEALVSMCADLMAGRGHNDATLPPIDAGRFKAQFQQAEAGLLLELGLRKKSRKIHTLDVYPGGVS